jgi:hypothetical protein
MLGQNTAIGRSALCPSTLRTFDIQIDGTSLSSPYVAHTTPLTCAKKNAMIV